MRTEPVSPAIVEREPQLALVADALDAAIAGSGGLVALEGPAGIGKTSVLLAARSLAEAREVEVLVARGADFEREFPYGVARQLLERPLVGASADERERLLGGAAARAAMALGLDGGRRGESDATSALAVPHSLYWLVANLAESRPLLLLVDDAHWADPASLRFITYLARRLEGLHVALVVAFRPDEPGSDRDSLARLAAEPLARVAHVPPLSEDAVTAVVGDRMGDCDESFAAACKRATGGNPLLLRELIGALYADDVAPTAGNVTRIGALGPRGVARSVLLRIGDLDPAVGALARATAVAGDGIGLRDAAETAGLTLEDAAAAADALADVHILDRDRPLRFVHPIVREAIYADVPGAERAIAHRRVAELLSGRGESPERVAAHLARTDPIGDPSVAERLEEAAAAAVERGAPDAAVRYAERALAEPPAADRRAAVVAGLGVAELMSGRAADASAHLEQAVDLLEPGTVRARVRLNLAFAARASDDPAAAVARFEAAIAEAEPVDPGLARAIEADMAAIAWQSTDWTERMMGRVPAWQKLTGDGPAELALISLAARMCITKGVPASRARALGLRSATSQELLESGRTGSTALHTGLYGLYLADEFDAVEDTLRRAERLSRDGGDVIARLPVEIMRSLIALRAGRVRDAEAHALGAIAATEATMLHPLAAPVVVAVLAKAQLAQGRVDDAERSLAELGPVDDVPAVAAFNWLLHARAELHAVRARHEDALADALAVGRMDEPGGLLNPAVPWRSMAAEQLVRLGRHAEACDLALEWLELAEAFGAPSVIGEALRGAALVAAADEDDRLALLERSESALRKSPARSEYAATLLALGAALRRRGRRGDAQERLRAAHEIAVAGGSTVLAERVADELRAAGARPRALMHSGVDALTASERRVADLAAGGASNKEIAQELFVTAKTVENHLGRVYVKLDIHSRAELADALASDG